MGGLGRGAVLVLVLAQLLAAGASGKRVNVVSTKSGLFGADSHHRLAQEEY